VKSKIQGRGMNALTQIMNAVERSHAPRLTFFNHEEECQRLELLAAVNDTTRKTGFSVGQKPTLKGQKSTLKAI
jgi:hypothetical protein